MWKKAFAGLIFAYLVSPNILAAQNKNSSIESDSMVMADSATISIISEELWSPIPERAALLSFILPGSGQAYNRSWWKVPIIYGGLGVSAWVIADNKRNYDLFRNAYNNRVQGNPDPFLDIYPNLNTLSSIRDTYYKWYQLSIIVTAAIYLMNGIEAYVDAHLKNFDIGEDLSFTIPLDTNPYSVYQIPVFGVTFRLQ
ncbi:DUF5683 domain-containing protein [Membranihabitans maritimus]|uniref:DUF5683 domain-containing protein n=1 Tax=Membranihabitans maritimus TaxID=2904244 RepID=UPI001F380A73|nr:DUF5683 domain-containing protein [Membranihabitans maritimus]